MPDRIPRSLPLDRWTPLLGRPRTLLAVGSLDLPALARRTGARVTSMRREDLPKETDDLFDLVLFDGASVLPSAFEAAVRQHARHVAPEGRLLVHLASPRPDVHRVLADAGLEVLVPEPHRPQLVVARRAPPAGPLTVTIGMLTMDEEESIDWMLDAIALHAPDARVVCVDSSTRDRTPWIAERRGAHVIRQLPPRGHAPAMARLMDEAAATTDALIYLDCDRTYPPALIPRLRALLESGIDVVNTSRVRRRPAAMPWTHYVANRVFAGCARAIVGTGTTDVHSGMRAYRASVLRSFAFDERGDALPIDTLLGPARRGYRVIEIPIAYGDREGDSKLRKVSGTVWTFLRLGRLLGVGSRGEARYEVWPA